MAKDTEFKSRDKVTHRMTKKGLVERNAVTGEETRVSAREGDYDLRREAPPQPVRNEQSTPPAKHRRQQRPPQQAEQSAADTAAEQPAQIKPDTGRLQFTAEEKPPEQPQSKKLQRARASAVRADLKLEQAQQALPTRRTVHTERVFNEETGKVKRRLQFETQVKSQGEHLRGSAAARPVKAAGNAVILYGHKKLHEVEHDNTGLAVAHKGELMAEGRLRIASHRRKTAPYRNVVKRQHKAARAHARSAYQQALTDNPKLKSNLLSRMAQKRKIQRQYAKAVRDAKKAAKRAKQTGSVIGNATKAIVGFVSRHPVACLVILLIALLVVFIMMMFSTASNLAVNGGGTILATSYLAPDRDIDETERSYTEWETDLQMEIANTEQTHPGYDEYRYSVDDIGHGPHELMAYLTAAHNEFSYSGVSGDLRGIFEQQYTLTYTEEIEIRTRTVTVIDPDTGDETQVEEEYEWRILNVNLTAQSFTDIITPRLDAEQVQRYSLLTRVKGNRQYVGSPFAFNWFPYVSSVYGWRVHPINGGKDNHRGVDIAVATGTEITAAHDGIVTFAANQGSYGLVVFIEGEDGIETRYAHCSELLVSQGQSVVMGDVIAKVGSTGSSTGPHLHYEVKKDGQYLNPLYFSITNDDGSSYIPPGTPGGIAIPEYPGAPMDNARFAAMLEEAQKHLGKRYVFGASGPNTFDCSGFVSYVLNHSIYPGFRRTNAQGIYNLCTPVSRADTQPGDLIFFTGYEQTDVMMNQA